MHSGLCEKIVAGSCELSAMDRIDANGFRANVGIILTRPGGSVFLAGRAGRSGWQLPQGGIRPEETARQAMFRELEEEIGLEAGDVKLLGRTRGWLRYRLPRRYMRRHSTPLCIGQKQRWYLLQLIGDEARVRFDATDAPEFDRWRWVDYWRPVKEVIYFKRDVYASALQELGPLAFPKGVPPQPEWWSRARR
jgi:putative (di)nucleoside polyphosphate hydrolase